MPNLRLGGLNNETITGTLVTDNQTNVTGLIVTNSGPGTATITLNWLGGTATTWTIPPGTTTLTPPAGKTRTDLIGWALGWVA